MSRPLIPIDLFRIKNAVLFATYATMKEVNCSSKSGFRAQHGIIQHEEDPPLPFVIGVPKTFEFVENVSSRIYVYGALFDVNNIRLISIKVQGYVFKICSVCFICLILKTKKFISVYVRAIVKELHTYKSPYTSASIKCPFKLQESKMKTPLFVGLVESELTTPYKIFFVENTSYNATAKIDEARCNPGTLKREQSVEFTVCVPAMFNVQNSAQLVEKIEMTRLLGAGRVVLYNTSISSNVNAVLRMYAREWAEGRETLEVVVLPWKLPSENGKLINIPYWAQQLSIDDCMYRYKRLSKYMVFNDLDEFLIPLKHENWSALVAERRRLKPQSIGWLFRCSVVSKDRPSLALGFEEDYLRYGASIFGLTMRDQFIYPPNDRVKLIVDPTTIEEMGVHLIWEGQGSTDNLPVDVGLLFHYRVPLSKCTPQVNETRLVTKYGKRLLARFKDIWSKLPGVELGWSPFKAGDKSECKSS